MQGNSSLEKQPQLTGDSPSFSLSHGQQAIWFLYQMAPQSVAYNIYTTVRISSSLDLGAWHRAWLRIVERHQVLRTTYTQRDGQPVQVVHLYQEVDVKVTDASSWSEDYLKKQILAEAECPYNLETGPVLRVHLFTRSPEEHIQLLAMHHIAGDMWSFDILLSELRILYAAEVKTLAPSSINVVENSDVSNSQRDNNIRALPNLTYTDYVRWQTEMLASSKGEQLAAYWQKQLAGELPLLDLPLDKPRPREQTYCGASHIIELDKELLQKIRQLSEAEGTSLYRILLAAFFVLLYRYTGQEDIPVGSPMAGRWSREEFQGIVGYFTSPVVCRANLVGNPTFKEFLRQVSRTVSEAREHQDYPFPLLVKELSPDRDISCHPLFQVSLTSHKHRWYDQAQKSPLKQEKTLLVMSPYLIEGHQRGAAVDLNLAIIEAGSSFQLCWQYNTDLFDISTVHRMASSYQTLLKSILTNPEERVSALPLLTQAERHQLLVEWNDNKVEYPFDKCIHQLFEEQVERWPDSEAVLFEDKQLTYRELNQRANCLAHHLRTLGVGPEVLVGICVERSLEMVVGLLGILKAGGAYVPLDPAYPPERLAFMLEDSQVGVLLTQARLVESIPKHQGCIVCLDTDWEIIERQSKENPECSFTPENLAYVIYTSGSTGKPKGVLVAHSGVSNLATSLIQISDVQPNSRVLQFCSLSFDGSVTELVMALLSGATMVMGTRDSLLPGPSLIQLLRDFEIATVALLPSVLAVLPANELPALRTVIAAGEACSRELVAKWSAGRRFFNGYGPTECTVCTTMVECTDSKEAPPIGRPLPNTQVYILDAQQQLVPIGVPGELYIGGVGVTRGYLNRPELTAERFIPHPFSNDSASRLYKTGDLARYLPDGNIEYLGRIDHQVKIRGFRIELGEIEAVLRQNPAVEDAVVIGQEYDLHDNRLVAYVVPSQEQVLSTSELRRYLKQKLPDHMVPSAFVPLEALPLTPNDKVDRRALPAPEFQPELQQSLVAPRTPIEEMLTSIWADVLRIELMGVHHNFFELGGHSLLATQVISRVRDTLAVELPLRSLFEAPTIAELASRVELELKNGQSQEAEPLVPIPRLESIPLSFAQARLWFLDQLQPNSAFYNMPLALRLSGQLNIAAIESSINEIIQRHEALRTNFTTQEGQPVQIIASTLNLKLRVVDLLYLPESSREIEAQRLAFEEANRPFNLEREPLIRGTALQLGETEYILAIAMHHIISDGWSLGVFVRELTELYQAFCTGSPPVLPLLPVQYADFAVWQRQWLSGEVLKTQLHYWTEQLKNAPNLIQLPTDRPRKAIQTFQGGYYSAALDKDLSAELTALSKRSGVTLFMTLVAAFGTLLYRLSGEDDIVVGTPVAGRNRREIEGLIGFFVNTLVLRTNLGGDPSFEELLGSVRKVALQAYTHQDLPFEQLVQTLQPTRDLSYTPLFQVMFVLDDARVPSVKLPELTVSSYSVEIGTAKFDLTLSMENTADGLAGVWEYNADLFDKATIARMAGHFQTLLEAIVANPQQKVSSLPLLTERERHQLLVDWNNTTKEYPSDKCIHQLFEQQVQLTPDAEAVLFEDKQLTYRELNQRANCLAHHLRTLGVGPEVLVGICVERSLEMVVGLLGILKAGGAYVPLDSAYPPERLAFMLEDSQVGVLLTQARLVESIPKHQGCIVCLDTDWEIIELQSEANLISEVKLDNLAYVIYTSGSTGKPKGVAIEHRNTVALLDWARQVFNPEEVAGVLASTSICFDLSVFELFVPLSCGGKVILAENALHLPTLWAAPYVTLINTVPSAIAELLRIDGIPSSVRTVNLAGEPLRNKLVQQVYEHNTVQKVFNLYGPSEDTTYSTYTLVKKGGNAPPPIGRPIANTQVYILDAQQQLVPIGVPGELYIGGAGLARGYLNRPELTADRFILNPFSNDSGSRLYKTGDLARYLPDGNIEFLGRIDHQVKIRGFRIELGEIEAVLRQNRAVEDTVVISQQYDLHDKRLVAYVVPSQEQVLSTSELRRDLKQKLPDHMVPSAFVPLEALPLTPNGKVDRRALPMPDGIRSVEETFAPPLTLFEEVLANIWSEVLRLDSVGIHDNFFELGGHSLLAVRLLAQIEKTFGKNLPLATLFQSPTIQQLGNILRQKGWSAPYQTLVRIQPGGSKRPLFFIHVLGKGLKFCRPLTSHLDPEQPIYGLAAEIMDEVSLSKVGDVVAHYIKEMRSIQPEGPYLLAGIYCGGRVAYEMAQQLHAQGQKVALLALLDTLKDGEAIKIIPVKDRVLAHGSNLLRLGPAYLLNKRRLGEVKNRLMSIYWKFYERLGLPLPQACQSFTYRKKKEEGNMEWVFAPEDVYPERVTLFRAIENMGFIEHDLGWSELAPGGLEIHDVPGDTYSMLQEPRVQRLAEKLRDCIDRVQGDDLAHILPLCSDPFVCDNEDSEGYHIQTSSGLK